MKIISKVAIGLVALTGTMASAQPPLPFPQESSASRPTRTYGVWTVFLHPRFGYELPVPPGVSAVGEPEALSEPKFTSRDGDFVMTSWAGMTRDPAPSVIEEQWRLALIKGGRDITYQRRGSSWFVVSGTDRAGTEFYEKFTMKGQHAAALSVTFPRSRLREFESWVEEIEDGFRPVSLRSGPPEMAPRLSLGLRDRDPESRTRNETHVPERPTARREIAESSVRPSPGKPKTEASSAGKGLPSATKVPGKTGFVYSPFSPDQKLVDVVGVPSGTKVKCPYTMKIFLVP